jgi:polyhydroxyalkanoate synthesis repressor PhaR
VVDTEKPLLIKRYASRRLYNTETSDYVTLEDIARFIRDGREVQIIDLKSGDNLTRQYLLQIIAEHESRGENVLPIAVLTDLVRSYAGQSTSVVPQFLAASFEMLRDSQEKMIKNLGGVPNPMAAVPGFDQMQKQQRAFLETMMGGWKSHGTVPGKEPADADGADVSEIDDIKRQLADLQKKLSGLN